jgi:hypothetical protein
MVQEYGMTSGLLLNRKYDQLETSFKLEKVRADPYHYPNHLSVDEHQHFEDRRARSQHIDPTRRKELARDRVLKEAVPEEMIQNTLMANYKDMKVKIDPDILGILLDPNTRPEPKSVKELNVDLSCVALPAREQRVIDNEKANAATKKLRQSKDWTWCLGGRKPFAMRDDFNVQLAKSASEGTLGGRSHLSHQVGAVAGPFHGTSFIAAESRPRMRGGLNAESGFAGTFPARELRPGHQ